ncbi:MAG: hypothetical protein ACKVOS_03525 [Sphingorhabdus sp.]|jgi:hypothetical protein|uniref:hypothetical protein n=1 Tax=Sphingorhabdus sp. TaxID=1902408 RepID=UPI0038FC2279
MEQLWSGLGIFLDFATIIASALAAWFWYLASIQTIHRVHATETFDYHDLNRIIVAINRNSIRNRRGALASAVAAALLAIDLGFDNLIAF